MTYFQIKKMRGTKTGSHSVILSLTFSPPQVEASLQPTIQRKKVGFVPLPTLRLLIVVSVYKIIRTWTLFLQL